jgi:phytol kinase
MTDVDWLRVAVCTGLIVSMWEAAGRLKRSGRFRPGDSRKLNHITCLTAGAVLFGWLPEAVARPSCYLGMAIPFSLLLVVCARGDRPPFGTMYFGYARESDAPHEAFHVWFSWLVSIVGLVGIDQLSGDLVVTRTACLVLGLADGVAEPVGVRWGRHRYRVPTLTGGESVSRSIEGSAAVFAVTFLVVLTTYPPASVVLALCVAAAVTLAEAVSPHGLDNLVIPLAVGCVLAGAERL